MHLNGVALFLFNVHTYSAYIICSVFWIGQQDRLHKATEFLENILSVTMLEMTRSKDPTVFEILIFCLFVFDCYIFTENILFQLLQRYNVPHVFRSLKMPFKSLQLCFPLLCPSHF